MTEDTLGISAWLAASFWMMEAIVRMRFHSLISHVPVSSLDIFLYLFLEYFSRYLMTALS